MTEHAGPDRETTTRPTAPARSSIPPPTRLAAVVLMAFSVCALVEAVSAVSNLGQLSLLDRIDELQGSELAAGSVTDAEIDDNDKRQQAVAVVQLATQLGVIVVFLMWVFQASKFAHSLRRTRMRITPGWAVGWWFIPIASMWMPYQAMTEIWRVSDHSRSELWQRGTVPWFFPTWWLVWLGTNILAPVAGRYDEGTLTEIRTGTQIGIAGDVVGAIAAAMALLVVRAMRDRQAAPMVMADVFD